MRISLLVGLLLLGLLFACQKNLSEHTVEIPPLVQAPIPDLDPKFEVITWKAEEGLEKLFSTGTQVRIPANALIDANGNRVIGEVELRFRELHDAISIFLSGVPMSYPNPQSTDEFTTAGTFELRVIQQNNPVFLDSTAMAEVRLASFESGSDYDFYYLDEEGRKWDSLGTAKPVVNPRKLKLKKELRRKQPRIAFPLSSKYFALNYESIIDVFYNNNLSNVDHSGIGKKIKKYGLSYQDLWSYDAITWEGKREVASMMVWRHRDKKRFPEWTKKLRCQFKPIKGKRYQAFVMTSDSSKTFTCEVEAVMPLKALLAFPPEKWNNDYEKTMAEVRRIRETYKQTAAVFRDFSVNGFGIYNWDKLWKQEERLELAARFRFPTKSFNDTLFQPMIVFIPGDGKSLVKMPKNTWEHLNIIPDKKGLLFSVLPGKKVSMYPKEQYARINFQELRKMESPEFSFKMEDAVAFETEKDLRKILGLEPLYNIP